MEAPAKLDRLERVTDLVLVLLDTHQPLTLDAIAHQVPGYPVEHAARRQAFERDKRLLRDEGIPVQTERLPGHEQYGYHIDRESFYLPDLALEPDEQVALHLAVAGVHLGDPSGRDALLKLGAAGLGDVRPIASMVPPAALIELFEAVRTHATAAFAYRGTKRRVAPVGLWFRFGHWYLVAWDIDRTAVRTFRVDRIEGEVTRGDAGDAAVPDDVEVDVKAALPDEPWEVEGDARVEMRVRVDALEARRVVDEVGEDKVVCRLDDGSVDLVLGVSSFASIRSWVLGLLDHVTVIEPAGFRGELVAWLDAVTAPAPPLPAEPRFLDSEGGSADEEPAAARERARARDQPSFASPLGAGRLAGAGRGGAHRRCRPAVRHEREGVGGRIGAGGVLRHSALYPGHADGDRGVRGFCPRLPAGGVCPAAPSDPRRGVCGRGLGAPAPRRAGVGGRRTAARPGQARCRARVP